MRTFWQVVLSGMNCFALVRQFYLCYLRIFDTISLQVRLIYSCSTEEIVLTTDMGRCNLSARSPESVSLRGNPEYLSCSTSSGASVASETKHFAPNLNCLSIKKHSRSRRRDGKLRQCSFHSVLVVSFLVVAFLSHFSSAVGASALGAHTDGQVCLTMSKFCA